MHKQYQKDGLAAVSLNLDDPADEATMKLVHDFLKSQKVTFASYVLKEVQEFWQEKFGIAGPPAVFVFGRDGKLAKKFTGEVKYEEVEKLATELLKKK